MNNSEWIFSCGPLTILKVGRVWAIDVDRFRVFGVGRRIKGYGRLPR